MRMTMRIVKHLTRTGSAPLRGRTIKLLRNFMAAAVGVKCMSAEELAARLGALPDEEVVVVSLRHGDVFELKNFDVVDESIYGNRYTVLSDIVRCISGDERVFTTRTKFEFPATDVVSASKQSSGEAVLERHT